MTTLKRVNGKHVVTIGGKACVFNTMRFALIFIKLKEMKHV